MRFFGLKWTPPPHKINFEFEFADIFELKVILCIGRIPQLTRFHIFRDFILCIRQSTHWTYVKRFSLFFIFGDGEQFHSGYLAKVHSSFLLVWPGTKFHRAYSASVATGIWVHWISIICSTTWYVSLQRTLLHYEELVSNWTQQKAHQKQILILLLLSGIKLISG